jgi:hypothetical protein
MKTSWKTVGQGVLTLLMGLILSACTTSGTRPPSPPIHASGIRTILVLPFVNVSGLYEPNAHARCYLCGQVMVPGYVPDSASPFLTADLISQMEKIGDYTILSSDGAEDVISGMMSDKDKADDRFLNLYIQAGKRAGADAIVVGHIFRFTERRGNRASVESPASVAFDLHLIDVANGRMLWSSGFDETQKPLTDNILEISTFIKRGGGWATAEELSESGLESIMQRFPRP